MRETYEDYRNHLPVSTSSAPVLSMCIAETKDIQGMLRSAEMNHDGMASPLQAPKQLRAIVQKLRNHGGREQTRGRPGRRAQTLRHNPSN